MPLVNTFEEACQALGLAIPEGLPEMLQPQNEEIVPERYRAQMKLEIIAAALNDDWEYRPEPGVYAYYPWFYFYDNEEVARMKPEEKEQINLVPFLHGQSNGFCGLAFSYSFNAWSHASSYSGARLACKSPAIAKHFGRKFTELWRDYLYG